MRADLRAIAEKVSLAATLASIGYVVFAGNRLRAFRRRAEANVTRTPPRPAMTVLKPVRGVEPGLEENLRSFCTQDYPTYQVVLGVRDPHDPALETLRRVAAEFPDRAVVAVGDGTTPFRNPKIATLATMLPLARYDVLVIADSDMRVGPDYLDAIAAGFADPAVGAVTAIYRGEAAAGDLPSALGAMWITEQFAPSTLVANATEPLAYCFGATMAVRRDVLDAIGGLPALGAKLADDYTLGRLVTSAGYRVALAPYVVANVVSEHGLRGLVQHEVRWARTIRGVRPGSYAGIVLTYPVPLALLHLALARRRRLALPFLAAAVLVRFGLHRVAHATLGTRKRPSVLLVPIRDALGLTIWGVGLAGDEVRWRDDDYRVSAGGTIAAHE